MTWKLIAANATTENSQNSYDCDMCIEEAKVIFEHVNIESIVFGAYEVHDFQHVLLESVAERTAKPEEYDDILSKISGGNSDILSMAELTNDENGKQRVCFTFDGGLVGLGMDLVLTISFSKSVVSWDKFSGKAWYEYPEWKKRCKNNKD